ncbi:MAG: YggS family pyridoxal phosphate-dependent enzyme [Pseudonocardiaceae bacterium]
MTTRAEELAVTLSGVRGRIAAACSAAGRAGEEVRLLAVTKTFPADDVALLTELGLTDFGEARDQEAAGKVARLAKLWPDAPVRWHMVGRLQRNKARSVARWAVQVQSVDSPRLVDALARSTRSAREAGEREGPLEVLVQASLDGDPGRGGCPLALLDTLAGRVAAAEGLELRGVMAVAPLDADPEPAFAALATAAQRVRQAHPGATELSAGMSGDLEIAIRHGSTCVRVGTALMGGRRLASP